MHKQESNEIIPPKKAYKYIFDDVGIDGVKGPGKVTSQKTFSW